VRAIAARGRHAPLTLCPDSQPDPPTDPARLHDHQRRTSSRLPAGERKHSRRWPRGRAPEMAADDTEERNLAVETASAGDTATLAETTPRAPRECGFSGTHDVPLHPRWHMTRSETLTKHGKHESRDVNRLRLHMRHALGMHYGSAGWHRTLSSPRRWHLAGALIRARRRRVLSNPYSNPPFRGHAQGGGCMMTAKQRRLYRGRVSAGAERPDRNHRI
jgi:hypothetical protein